MDWRRHQTVNERKIKFTEQHVPSFICVFAVAFKNLTEHATISFLEPRWGSTSTLHTFCPEPLLLPNLTQGDYTPHSFTLPQTELPSTVYSRFQMTLELFVHQDIVTLLRKMQCTVLMLWQNVTVRSAFNHKSHNIRISSFTSLCQATRRENEQWHKSH